MANFAPLQWFFAANHFPEENRVGDFLTSVFRDHRVQVNVTIVSSRTTISACFDKAELSLCTETGQSTKLKYLLSALLQNESVGS